MVCCVKKSHQNTRHWLTYVFVPLYSSLTRADEVITNVANQANKKLTRSIKTCKSSAGQPDTLALRSNTYHVNNNCELRTRLMLMTLRMSFKYIESGWLVRLNYYGYSVVALINNSFANVS